MNKKRAMLACAIGAILILVGSGVARCAMHPPQDSPGDGIEEVAEKTDGNSFKDYVGSAWSADGGSKTLAITDGVMVERDGVSTAVTYFDVISEDPDDGGLSVNVTTSKGPRDTPKQGVVRIDSSTTSITITCDAFSLSATYTLDASPDSEVSLAAHSEKLNDLLESDDERISGTITGWAAKRSPYATSATWDGEVYIDCNGKTVTTSFTLNDGAGTLVQLRYDQTTKELSAL